MAFRDCIPNCHYLLPGAFDIDASRVSSVVEYAYVTHLMLRLMNTFKLSFNFRFSPLRGDSRIDPNHWKEFVFCRSGSGRDKERNR